MTTVTPIDEWMLEQRRRMSWWRSAVRAFGILVGIVALAVTLGLIWAALMVTAAHAGNCNGNHPTCILQTVECPYRGPVEVRCDCSAVAECASTAALESSARAVLEAVEQTCARECPAVAPPTSGPQVLRRRCTTDKKWRAKSMMRCRTVTAEPLP